MKICTVSESREQKYPHRKPSHAPRQPATTDSLGNWFQAGERRQMPPPTTHWEGIARASWFVGFLQDSHLAKCPIAQQSPLLFPRTAERVVGGSSSPTPGGRGGGTSIAHTSIGTPSTPGLALQSTRGRAATGCSGTSPPPGTAPPPRSTQRRCPQAAAPGAGPHPLAGREGSAARPQGRHQPRVVGTSAGCNTGDGNRSTRAS